MQPQAWLTFMRRNKIEPVIGTALLSVCPFIRISSVNYEADFDEICGLVSVLNFAWKI
jgi:hypothetical protein